MIGTGIEKKLPDLSLNFLSRLAEPYYTLSVVCPSLAYKTVRRM